MGKIKLSIIALSCAMALSACSSSSKGGTDNTDQIRQAESELSQKITEANKKAEEAAKKAEAAIKTAKANSEQTEAEKKAAEEAQKAAEERLKQLENLQANEKARIPLSDKVFGGISGEMTDAISGGTLVGEQNIANRTLAHDIRDLTIIDESGKLVDINILRRADDMDPWTYEAYDDQYNLRKEGQTILSNSNLESSAFGTYVDRLTGNQYFYAQGKPTAMAQIPTVGKAEYKGGAVYKKDGERNYSEISEMTATADFANKVIDINIAQKANAVPGMNFGGKITGNSFAGEVNGIKTQGGFFGENAKEMTGLYTNEADQSRGAFGGIKQ
ncbi:transferrin-binding protein-like solute binding protein [Haemophilus sputorum]|jgi:Transferrin binding protein-like solute binding protein.|uniref:ABC transporter substrate-binding protein n=1 Tax=Haemophilus sputorum TaxID=1078480 RepID=A0ABX9HQN5_9PAST|nr:transferrin-binding protein-like solute binding protein [Haemophilus sputorum]RDF07434.1 ABC transporter substrate-binding protein [Haemophilus sputorum]RDF11116.1 ABC transporter substrate-binding protein [Haemophilus sputorum]